MFLKLSNYEPEHSVWIRSELIVTIRRPAGCKYTEIMTSISSPQGVLAYQVVEDPEAIIALLTNTLH